MKRIGDMSAGERFFFPEDLVSHGLSYPKEITGIGESVVFYIGLGPWGNPDQSYSVAHHWEVVPVLEIEELGEEVGI